MRILHLIDSGGLYGAVLVRRALDSQGRETWPAPVVPAPRRSWIPRRDRELLDRLLEGRTA